MSHPDDHGRNDRPEAAGGTPEGRRRGRLLIPLLILLVIAGIFTYILVVAQSGGGEDSQIYDNEGAGTVTVLEIPAADG